MARAPVGPAMLAAAALLAFASPSRAAEQFVAAAVDSTGALRLERASGPTIVVTMAPGQAGFDQITIAPNRRAVGWLDLFENPNTSYPIPLQLVVRSGGEARTYTGNGLPIWHWRFLAGGKQIAFEQETVHGGMGVHYELRVVASGRLFAAYNPEIDADGRPVPGQEPPKWVAELDAARR